LHATPHVLGAVHVAVPCPEAGAAQTFAHDPQCDVCVGSTHDPLQSSGVPPSGSQPTPHTPLVHVAWPTPASGPGQTLPQLPQLAGRVGSTHDPLQSRGVPPSASQPTPHTPFVHVA